MFFGGASDVSGRVDAVFLYIAALTAAFLVFITALMIYFVVKYSRKRNPNPADIRSHAWLEVTWTAIPLVLFLSMFYYGWTNYHYMRSVPRDAMVVKVTGRQWAWSFSYPNGKGTSELVLAVRRPVKLEFTSPDVVHGFYIPAFRVKQDVVPGQTNWTWFTPEKEGVYDIECTVICGVSHSYMLSKVHVVPEERFKAWYFSDAVEPPAETAEAASGGPLAGDPDRGRLVYAGKACATCHTLDGARLVGPSWKGLYGSRETVVTDGKERPVTVDDTYIARSIRAPGADVVKGYPPAMVLPHSLDDQEVADVVAFLKTLK